MNSSNGILIKYLQRQNNIACSKNYIIENLFMKIYTSIETSYKNIHINIEYIKQYCIVYQIINKKKQIFKQDHRKYKNKNLSKKWIFTIIFFIYNTKDFHLNGVRKMMKRQNVYFLSFHTNEQKSKISQ